MKKHESERYKFHRHGKYAAALDKLGDVCGDSLRQEILAGESELTRQDVVALAKEDNPAALGSF